MENLEKSFPKKNGNPGDCFIVAFFVNYGK